MSKTPKGMRYCRVYKEDVYSCDHAECNGGNYKEQQGMKYCKVQDDYVYGCDHYDCQ